jgi:hypothetical protein
VPAVARVTPVGGSAPVAAIREEARLAVEATSLRSVARAIGMSPMGLKHFLEGRSPYSATTRKLNAWYVAHRAQRPGFDASAARAALVVLTDGIPEQRRPRAEAVILQDVWAMHGEAGTRPPAWLVELRGELGGE